MVGRAAPGRGRQGIHNFGSRLSLLLGVDCSLGCCSISAYTFSVWFGCFAFVLWGCYCDDPEQGYANDWNRIYHPKEGLEDDGHYVHHCAVHFAASLGLEWCVAVGLLVAAYADTYVPEPPCWATRTSLLRAVRIRGTGQVAPGAPSTVRTPYAYQPRAYRTYAYRGTTGGGERVLLAACARFPRVVLRLAPRWQISRARLLRSRRARRHPLRRRRQRRPASRLWH